VHVRRPRFLPGQLLTADDLNAIVDYVESERRRHNLALHGAGVVRGLEVTATPATPPALVVSPGAAIDPQGRLVTRDRPCTLQLGDGEAAGAVVILAEERLVEPVPDPDGDGVEHRAVETTAVVALRPATEPPGPADVLLARLVHGRPTETSAT
jgi:hypothetical protein